MKTYSIVRKVLIVVFLTFGAMSLFSCATTQTTSSHSGLFEGDYDRIISTATYRKLATLDLDQVNDLLQEKINRFNRDNDPQALKESAFIVFARPDDDGMVEKVLPHVQTLLEEEREWENTIVSLVRQSIDNMNDSKVSAADQVTAGVILENIVAELKPFYIKQYKTGGFETEVVNQIAASNVSYSKAASRERGLYLMRNNLNPSQIAKKVVAQKTSLLDKEEK